MYNQLFSNLEIKSRPKKPREYGLTVLIDRGLGIKYLEDFLDLSADYIDLAKIITGTSALLNEEKLKSKIELYKRYNISAFPGGMFFEYARAKGKEKEYFNDIRKAGYQIIEISNNRVNISIKEKCNLIKLAIEKFGLEIIGETGSKKKTTDILSIINDIKECLEYGSWKVTLEANELFNAGQFNEKLVKAIIKNKIKLKDIIFELPTPRLAGITACNIYFLQTWLIKHLGSNVNIANVEPQEVLCLEAERMNLGSHMRI